MDDGRLRGAMVDGSSQPGTHSERPFALRATVFTLGFLIVILGVLPALFFALGEGLFHASAIAIEFRFFWNGFIRLVGASLFAGGFIAYIACSAWLIYFGRGPHVEFDPPKVFVATGPYRWVRNPVVICLLVTAIGEALYFSSIGIGVFVVLGMVFAQVQVTRIEEPRLRKRFGESYDAYCQKVHRWIPRPPVG
jgi:protein-S-isoprenylcysteine O-methyltransferase Ste14